MTVSVTLLEALQDRRLFRAGQPLAHDQGATPSGFAPLDEALPWQGFPRGALTEILLSAPGVGELQLIRSAWMRIGAQERLAFVAPPFIPYAPALLAARIPLARFAWIDVAPDQAAWAAEQCLRAGCLGAVALWSQDGDERRLRRLQLAAEEGSSHAFVFRPARHAVNPSPAALRLQLEANAGEVRVRVLKCRGALAPSFALPWPRDSHEARTPAAAATALDDARSSGNAAESLRVVRARAPRKLPQQPSLLSQAGVDPASST
jgi:hypothetical protein